MTIIATIAFLLILVWILMAIDGILQYRRRQSSMKNNGNGTPPNVMLTDPVTKTVLSAELDISNANPALPIVHKNIEFDPNTESSLNSISNECEFAEIDMQPTHFEPNSEISLNDTQSKETLRSELVDSVSAPDSQFEKSVIQNNNIEIFRPIPEVAFADNESASEQGAKVSKAETKLVSQSEATNTSNIPLQEEASDLDASQRLEDSHTCIPSRLPQYRPPTSQSATKSQRRTRTANRTDSDNFLADLHLRLQVVFGRGGGIGKLAFVPDRRGEMPSEIDVTGIQGVLHLTSFRDDRYEPIMIANPAEALRRGIEWRAGGRSRSWRWVLRGRQLYVLTAGDQQGFSGFISTSRLRLNARHIVLATKSLQEAVQGALRKCGCAEYRMVDDDGSGLPEGWVLFRDVEPTQAVPMREETDILNSLCPDHEMKAHFVGGIRLERNIWLAGYPPRIRLTGELPNGSDIRVDGHIAHRACDRAFEAQSWDAEGEHLLNFGGRTKTYSLQKIDESWQLWHPHTFDNEAAVCGATVCMVEETPETRVVRVRDSNPLLIGTRPGEIFRCCARRDLRSETLFANVPFEPVWALPVDPAHAKKQSTRILLLNAREPQNTPSIPTGDWATNRNVRAWITAIRNAGCKGLAIEPDEQQAKALWRSYRKIANQLRKKRNESK